MSKKKKDLDEYNVLDLDPNPYPDLNNKKNSAAIVWVAIIGAISTVLAAVISGTLNCDTCTVRGEREAEQRLMPTISDLQTQVVEQDREIMELRSTTSVVSAPREYLTGGGQVQGILTDRSGAQLPNMKVMVKGSSQTTTDSGGSFILTGVTTGYQRITVEAPSGSGEFSQNIYIEEEKETYANLVFDTQSMQLGLLSITAPASNSSLEAEAGVQAHQIILGRCDGLAQIYGGYDKFSIWILVRAIQDDSYLHVQMPPAIVDRNSNTWQTSVYMGSEQHPPYDGQRWIIEAVAAPVNSGMQEIVKFESLESLSFDVITSNVVSVTMEVK